MLDSRLARKWAATIFVLVAVLGGQVVSTLLKLGFERPRPDLVPDAPLVFTASFPSGHATLSAVTYLSIGALLTRLNTQPGTRRFFIAAAVLLPVLVGLSRIALGLHWPTDVLAGWCVGSAWAIGCTFMASRLMHGKEDALASRAARLPTLRPHHRHPERPADKG